ncbi:MAG: VCBS repeat-containing protein, partial [Saprospiraceae bacterium]|nr:VCBS repeat-containing protein [Saprospiraceae bacterium]
MGLTLQKLEQSPLNSGPFFWLALIIAFCLSFQRANALSSNQVSVTNKSGTRFILDSNSPCTGPRAAYVAYEITNTTNVVLTGLNASLGSLSSGFALAGGQTASQSIGTLAPGASTTLFWYISYPCTVSQTTNIAITVSDSNPGTRSFSFNSTTRNSVSASAGGLLIGRSIGAGLTMGQTTHVDVEYDLGNVPNNGFAYFQPSGNSDFNAGCLKLIGSQVLLSAIPSVVPVGSMNTLNYVASASAGGGSNRVVIRYTFRIACSSITSVMKPYAASNNGNQVKHTSNYGSILVNIPTDFPPADPCLSGSQDEWAALQTNTGIDATGDDWSASWGDYNNDGYPDLFIATNDPKQTNSLYRNNGNGTFSKVTTAPFSTDAAASMSSSWGDYDNDRDLDLYVANNIGFDNFLYRNEGGGNFTKILNDPIVSDKGYSHGVSWADYDNDGFLDMFVAVYWETAFNKLYHNNGDGTFSEVTNNPITNEASRSVSGAWGDYDNDGLLDLFVANTGGQNNSLYHNLGGGKFERITTGIQVTDGGSSVGANWADYNNDGYLDLFVTNAGNEPCYLYKNTGGGVFTKITTGTIVTDRGDAHGSAWADWDNDGDLDLFVARDGRNN